MQLLTFGQFATPKKILTRVDGGVSWENPKDGGIYDGSGDLSGLVDIRQGNHNLEFTNTGGNVLVDTTTLVVNTEENSVGIHTSSPVSTLDVGGSVSLPVMHESSNMVLDESHHTVFAHGQIAPTITLFDPDFCSGRMYRIARPLPGTGTISEYITNTGANSTSYSRGVLLLQSDGSNWRQVN